MSEIKVALNFTIYMMTHFFCLAADRCGIFQRIRRAIRLFTVHFQRQTQFNDRVHCLRKYCYESQSLKYATECFAARPDQLSKCVCLCVVWSIWNRLDFFYTFPDASSICREAYWILISNSSAAEWEKIEFKAKF